MTARTTRGALHIATKAGEFVHVGEAEVTVNVTMDVDDAREALHGGTPAHRAVVLTGRARLAVAAALALAPVVAAESRTQSPTPPGLSPFLQQKQKRRKQRP